MPPGDTIVPRALGWRCAVCAASVDVAEPFPWRCPNATDDDRRHLLQLLVAPGGPAGRGDGEETFVDHDHDLAWSAFAAANGMTAAARRALVTELDGAVESVAGVGFRRTPFGRSDGQSDELGFAGGGGVWVKDETGGVAGRVPSPRTAG